jgi:hypothetical protein
VNKILVISSCDFCPHLRHDYQAAGDPVYKEFCSKERRVFSPSDDDPPAWCPLENAQMCNNAVTTLRDTFNQIDSYFRGRN